MRIFELDRGYNVIFEPQAILLKPFAALVKRDKSKTKTRANKELAFVYFYCDIKSDYTIHEDLDIRRDAIKADLVLDKRWKIDKIMQDAIDFYDSRSVSITATILKDSIYVAKKLSKKMRNLVDDATKTLDINEVSKLLDSVKKMPDVIKSIQIAERAVLKEIKEEQGKLGSKTKALFEDGL